MFVFVCVFVQVLILISDVNDGATLFVSRRALQGLSSQHNSITIQQILIVVFLFPLIDDASDSEGGMLESIKSWGAKLRIGMFVLCVYSNWFIDVLVFCFCLKF
jgi:hypothetical protein